MSIRTVAAVLVCATSITCGRADDASEAEADRSSGLSSDCTGLVPQSLPPPNDTTVWLSDACSPTGATNDGAGYFAAGKTCGGNGFESWAAASQTMAFNTSVYDVDEREERHLFGQPSGGFLALNWRLDGDGSSNHHVVSLRSYAGDGTQTGEHFLIDLTGTTFPDRSWSIAPVTSGGVQITHVSLPGDGSWHLYTQRWSGAGIATDGVQQLATAFNSAVPQHTSTGVAVGKQALVAWDNGTEGRAVWTDAVGHLLGGTFGLPFRIDRNVVVAPLLDGSIAFRANGNWIGTLAPGSHTVAAAPAWLSTRPGSDLFLARGGRAHALFTQPPDGSCQAHLVLFAPAGNRCGAIDLRSGDENGCASRGEIAPDGTAAIQGFVQFFTQGSAPSMLVTQRFYPQLVK